MTEHDLSALDGLLDELDIEEKGNEDPRAAKLIALFEKAKANYTAKIDYPTWYISSSTSTAPFDSAAFEVPNPKQLLAQRKGERTGSTNQEWTVNYLYAQGHFELCLSYVTSFAVSMGVDFDFAAKQDVELEEYDSSQLALRRSKQERELSKNWGVIKDIIDAGIRSLLTLRRTTSLTSIEAWVPDANSYQLDQVRLDMLASGFLTFCMREIRVGAGDSRSGYSGMVVASPDTPHKFAVDMDKVKLQSWTVTHGLALTTGDLALEFGLYRTAIEAHTLFLACRGQMWRVLVALANELVSYSKSLSTAERTEAASLDALKVVAKAAVVSALQAIPRPRRLELAHSILVEHRVIPVEWIKESLSSEYAEKSPFEEEDDLLFNGLLLPLSRTQASAGDGQRKDWTVLPEEVGIALVKVIFAKKSGLFAIFTKFPTYMREYTQRLEAAATSCSSSNGGQEWTGGELEAAEEDNDAEAGPRSVRTL